MRSGQGKIMLLVILVGILTLFPLDGAQGFWMNDRSGEEREKSIPGNPSVVTCVVASKNAHPYDVDRLVAGDQTVPAAGFVFTAINDRCTIKELRLRVVSAQSAGVITTAVLKDELGMVYGRKPFAITDNTAAFGELNISIPKNSRKGFVIELELGTPDAEKGTSGADVKIILETFTYVDSQGMHTSEEDISGKSIVVYKCVPSVTTTFFFATYFTAYSSLLRPGTLVDGAEPAVLNWRVRPSSGCSIGIKQFTVGLTWKDFEPFSPLRLEELRFFKNEIDITSLVRMSDQHGNPVTGDRIAKRDSLLVVTFLTEDTARPETSSSYTLTGVSKGFRATSSGKDSLALRLLGDVHPNPAKYVSKMENNLVSLEDQADQPFNPTHTANFIWSDYSSFLHSSEASPIGGSDWMNGYLVRTLPLPATAWVAE